MTEPTVVHIQTNPQPRSFVQNTLDFMSTLSQRVGQSLFGVSKNGKRDINQVYGYKSDLSFNDFYWMWKRGGLAARIVNCIPRSCWRDGISFSVGDDKILEKEIKVLCKKGKLLQKLERADIMNRIGKFSVLYVGVPDGQTPDKPLKTASPSKLGLVFFTPYAEDGVEIVQWETDVASPRYGQPLMYQLSFQSRGDNDKAILTQAKRVHWTRVVHIAEGLLDNDVEGTPALEPIFNALEDLNKTTGGAAEAYFRNARTRFSMEVDPKFNGQLDSTSKASLEEEALRFQNEWQDFIRAGGIQIKPISTPHNDPIGTAKVIIQVLSGTTGIAQRILIGEGAGQLAGNEDKESYNQLIQDRKELYCSDWVMSVFTVLSNAKMLDLPEDAEVIWTTPEVMSDTDKATNANSKATALSSVASALSTPALDGVVKPSKVFELVFGKEAVIDLDVDDSFDDGIDDEGGEGTGREDPLGIAAPSPAEGTVTPPTGEPQ